MTSCCSQSKSIFAGDTLRLTFQFTDSSGAVLDLTGSTHTWSLFAQRGQPATLSYTTGVDSELVVTDAAGGVVTLDVPGATTETLAAGGYLYQLETTLPGPPVTDITGISGAVIEIKARL